MKRDSLQKSSVRKYAPKTGVLLVALLLSVTTVKSIGGSLQGTSDAIRAPEAGLRKALANHLKKAAKEIGREIDMGSIGVVSTTDLYLTIASFNDYQDPGAIAYIDAPQGRSLVPGRSLLPARSLFELWRGEDGAVKARNLFTGEQAVIQADPPLDPSYPTSLWLGTAPTGRRIFCWPGEDGTISTGGCGDLDALPRNL